MADISVLNTSADLSGKTVVTAEGDRTISGLFTFSRGAGAAPFAVAAGAGVVANLVADASLLTGTLAFARFPASTVTYLTSSATGTQNNWDPGVVGNSVVLWAGSADLTITGLPAGVNGQMVTIINLGTANIYLTPNSGSSTYKLANYAMSGNTPLAAPATNGVGGSATYIYNSGAWRLVAHQQGQPITPAYAAGHYTANGSMTWTVEAGDVQTDRWTLIGKHLFTTQYLYTTSVGGTLNTDLRIALPFGLTGSGAYSQTGGLFRPSDNGSTTVPGYMLIGVAGTYITVNKNDVSNWSASTNGTVIGFSWMFEVA
jgi:hypothetical protein